MQKNDVYCEKMSTNSLGNHRIKIHLQLQNVAENLLHFKRYCDIKENLYYNRKLLKACSFCCLLLPKV